MDKYSHPLATTLRWLALLWLVGWAVYVTGGGHNTTLPYAREMIVDLAFLLIPVILIFGVAWALDRFPVASRNHHRLAR